MGHTFSPPPALTGQTACDNGNSSNTTVVFRNTVMDACRTSASSKQTRTISLVPWKCQTLLWNKSTVLANSCLPRPCVPWSMQQHQRNLFCTEPLSPSTCETLTGILIKINPPLVAFQLLMAAPSHLVSGGSSAWDPFDWPRRSPHGPTLTDKSRTRYLNLPTNAPDKFPL